MPLGALLLVILLPVLAIVALSAAALLAYRRYIWRRVFDVRRRELKRAKEPGPGSTPASSLGP